MFNRNNIPICSHFKKGTAKNKVKKFTMSSAVQYDIYII